MIKLEPQYRLCKYQIGIEWKMGLFWYSYMIDNYHCYCLEDVKTGKLINILSSAIDIKFMDTNKYISE